MRAFCLTVAVCGYFFLIGLPSSFAESDLKHACPPAHHWVRAHHRNAYIKADGTEVAASNVTAHCQANPPGYGAWVKRIKNGKASDWLQRKEKAKPWSEDERERVFEALSTLPAALLVDSVKGLYRLVCSQLYDSNPASGQDGQIALYDAAFGSSQNLTRILGHEMAHEVYRHLSVGDRRNYLIAADWLPYKNSKTGEWILIPNRDEYVEMDGKEDPAEDFGNNIEYFLFNPNVLRAKTPKVYNWIQNKFGDSFKLGKGARQ